MVCRGSEVNKCDQAKEDLKLLCKEAAKDGVSLLARNKNNGAIVGVCFNKIQFASHEDPNAPSYFESFRDNNCKSPSSKSLMSYMIEMDSRVDLFEYFKIDCLLEIMFLGVIPEYEKKGIGAKLCEVSIDIAKGIKNETNLELLKPHVKDKRPKLVSALFTSNYSQKVGQKLQFKTIYEESYENFVFNDQKFSSRIGLLHPTSTLVAKEI